MSSGSFYSNSINHDNTESGDVTVEQINDFNNAIDRLSLKASAIDVLFTPIW